MITTIFMIVNVLSLVCLGIGWFKSKYIIVDLETWNTVAEFYNENNKEVEELVGGCGGFFREYLYEEDEEHEEDDDE